MAPRAVRPRYFRASRYAGLAPWPGARRFSLALAYAPSVHAWAASPPATRALAAALVPRRPELFRSRPISWPRHGPLIPSCSSSLQVLRRSTSAASHIIGGPSAALVPVRHAPPSAIPTRHQVYQNNFRRTDRRSTAGSPSQGRLGGTRSWRSFLLILAKWRWSRFRPALLDVDTTPTPPMWVHRAYFPPSSRMD